MGDEEIGPTDGRGGRWRTLAAELLAAIADETPDPDDMPPPARTRFELLRAALAAADVPETGYRNHCRAFVRLVERCYRAHYGCPVLLAGEMGRVYRLLVEALAADGQYPVLRPRAPRPRLSPRALRLAFSSEITI